MQPLCGLENIERKIPLVFGKMFFFCGTEKYHPLGFIAIYALSESVSFLLGMNVPE